MNRLPRSFVAFLLSASWALSGCGGTGPTTTMPAPAAPSPPTTSQPGPQPSTKDGETKLVTPVREVDPSKLTKVVREEVKGGEATEGPTPENYLWLPAQLGQIQDEPITVEVPSGLMPLTLNVTVPSSNPMTKAKVELGRQLYFDPRVSKDGTVSCATCHNPEKGWTDNLPVSVGILGQKGSRSAPTVINTVFGKSMFWDGRAPSLEGQAQGPIQNKIEMGDQAYKEIIERLRTIPGYRDQFRETFGTDVTLDGMAKAIASFERTVLSGNSRYDKYTRDDDFKALTESQKRGMVLFGLRLNDQDPFKTDVVLKKANCTSCHVGFNFTDEQFHNLGVGWNANTAEFADYGRFAVSPVGAKNPSDIGAFKTPTLRDIAKTAPYLHDGSEATLDKVVEFYDRGGNPNPYLDKDMKKLNLTDKEQDDVVAFLNALTGEGYPTELPKLPAGPDGKSPDPRAAFTPPAPRAAVANPHGIFTR